MVLVAGGRPGSPEDVFGTLKEDGRLGPVCEEVGAEVDTDYEDDVEDGGEDEESAEAQAEEVEEELDCEGDGPASKEDGDRESVASGDPNDYVVPEANREVWKKFGCNTEAGRALRRLYSKPGGASEVASRIAYPRLPSPSQPWAPKVAPKGPCPQRASVRLPRPGHSAPDPEDPRNWREPVYDRRKPAQQILLEMEMARPQVPNLPKGRNQSLEKRNLQDRFQYCGGRAMPKGAMGHVAKTEGLPEALPNPGAERRRRGEDGLNGEERDIFEELTLAIKHKQARLAELDAPDVADSRPSKSKTSRNREALELQNDIQRCVRDLEKLLEITENRS